MTQIEQIKNEINRLKSLTGKNGLPEARDYYKGKTDAYNSVLQYINSLPTAVEHQPSEDLVDAARDIRDTLYLEEGKRDDYGNPYFLQDTIMKAVIAGANFQKERDIKKACEWLKMCVDVDDEVKMVNGEPEAHSFIQKIRHRTEVANQIIGDFKKFMDE